MNPKIGSRCEIVLGWNWSAKRQKVKNRLTLLVVKGFYSKPRRPGIYSFTAPLLEHHFYKLPTVSLSNGTIPSPQPVC